MVRGPGTRRAGCGARADRSRSARRAATTRRDCRRLETEGARIAPVVRDSMDARLECCCRPRNLPLRLRIAGRLRLITANLQKIIRTSELGYRRRAIARAIDSVPPLD